MQQPLHMLNRLRRALWRKLHWRLFAAYIVILIATVSLQTISASLIAWFSISDYVNSHRNLVLHSPDALASRAIWAFTLSLFLTTCVSVIASTGASLFVSQRIVEPLQRMIETSRRIAEGRYHDRVPVSDDYEISHLAVSLNSMAATLERTEQQRQELISNVAHELRTPLTTIKGYMEGLIDGIVPADEATYALVREEADRLSRLVQDLQELSRLEEAGVTLNIRPIRVDDVVAGVIQKMRPQLSERYLTLTTSVPRHLPFIQADYDRLQQILLNLVDNALHYTPPGGTISIEASYQELEQTISLSVIDTGVGIAAEHVPHIFTRFYRVDKSRSRAAGGSGIGLTIAQRLTEAHGGHIGVVSEQGCGSTFTVTFPAAPLTQQISA